MSFLLHLAFEGCHRLRKYSNPCWSMHSTANAFSGYPASKKQKQKQWNSSCKNKDKSSKKMCFVFLHNYCSSWHVALSMLTSNGCRYHIWHDVVRHFSCLYQSKLENDSGVQRCCRPKSFTVCHSRCIFLIIRSNISDTFLKTSNNFQCFL